MPLSMTDSWVWLRRSALIGLAALLVLGLVTVLLSLGDIERDLEKRASEALDETGLSDLEVVFHGRDGTLRGVVGSEAGETAAVNAVAGVRGVRGVRSELVFVDNMVPAGGALETTVVTTPSPAIGPGARGEESLWGI